MVFDSSNKARFSDTEYDTFRKFLEQSCGILLGENKHYLIDSRLRRMMTQHNFANLTELVKMAEKRGNEVFRQGVIDAMTTNETLWFRDKHPFDYFRDSILPEIFQAQDGPSRVWCCASSTGQEPYSLSMCVEEYRRKQGPTARKDLTVLATDIATSVLDQARSGQYDVLAINRGLTQDRLTVHFRPTPNGQQEVRPEIRQRVDFRQFNLKDPFVTLGRFDVVFCRNVLIYFSTDLQTEILRKIHSVLKPGGYLFVGGSETPKGLAQYFTMKYYNPGVVYQKK
jgi:chemotaxis protein methyltransferase CheR